jgi:hypothetical protein
MYSGNTFWDSNLGASELWHLLQQQEQIIRPYVAEQRLQIFLTQLVDLQQGVTVAGLPAGLTSTTTGGVLDDHWYTNSWWNIYCSDCSKPMRTDYRSYGTVTLGAGGTLALTSAAGTDNQTVCSGTAITNISYTIGGTATGVTVAGLPAGLTSTTTGGVLTITGTPTAGGTYTVTAASPCGPVTLNGTVTLGAGGTLALTSAAGTDNQTVCSGTAITNISYTIGGTATGVTVAGLPAGLTSTTTGGVLTITGTPTAGGTYTVTAASPCGPVTLNGTVTLGAGGTLALTSAAGTDNQTVCSGTAITNISYTIGGTATGVTVAGLPAGLTSTTTGGVLTITGTPTAGGTYTVTAASPCGPITLNGTVTLGAGGTLALTSAAGTDNQTVCSGTAITNISYTIGGTATGVTVAGLPAGLTSTTTGGVLTITGTPTAGGTYTVTAASPCGPITLNGTVTLGAGGTLVLTSAAGTDNQTVCSGTAITNISYTIGGTATGVTVAGLPAGLTSTTTGGVLTITGTPTAGGTYTVTAASPCGPITLSWNRNTWSRRNTGTHFSSRNRQPVCM